MCSIVKRSSHPMHIGGSSPFNKKDWVIKEWPMCNLAITVSSVLFVRGQIMHCLKSIHILFILFSRNSPHSDCHRSNTYLFVRGFRSEKGMSSTEMSPTRASLIYSRISSNAHMAGDPDRAAAATFCCCKHRFTTASRHSFAFDASKSEQKQ